jgi:threonine dehydratase
MRNTTTTRITPAAIQDARARIRAEFLDSRQIEDSRLSRAVGARLICKIESENPVGCFKGRGAESFINALAPDSGQLITASAGNFGLALANAAKQREILITVYAAETASPTKLERLRRLGAEVKLAGQDFDAAKEHARIAAQETCATFVEDGREPAITLGAGTMAMEITRDNQHLDTMLVPLGNGALLAGIACWLRARSPKTQIIGVCAEGAPAMERSWRSHTFQSTANVRTIADGIAVRVPVPEALEDIQNLINDIVLVSEDAIRRSLKLFYETLGLVAEPAGVVGIAALLSHSCMANGTVCTPITGGNTTEEQLRRWIAETK